MKKVYVETYGCTSNQNDSEIIKGLLVQQGYEIVPDESSADVVIVNTCAVKSATENKIRHRLQQLKSRNKKLVVAGCLTEAEPEIIRNTAPDASMIGTNRLEKIADVVGMAKRTELLGKLKPEKPLLPKWRSNPVVELVEVESGCSYGCFFCATKLAKGATQSYGSENIISQIARAKEEGCMEFFITGQDVADYRHNGIKLPELINAIASRVRGRYFLRMGMMHPGSVLPILDKLIEAYSSEKVYKFLHLPVQSGSDEVLKKMNRRHTTKDFIENVNAFRKAMPEITIWTDMIVGYPCETESDFEQSMQLIKETKPDFVNISSYSVRPKTRAAKMKQLTTQIKKDRTRKMSELVSKISLERNKRWIGWQGDVLIDEYNEQKGNFIGRNYAYKPVAVKGECKLGQIVPLRVVSAQQTCLIGI